MFVKGLTFLVNVVGALWLLWAGIYAGLWWDRRPAGWPHYEVRCCLVVHWTLKLPDSLGAQLASSAGDLKTCRANVSTLDAALSRQNAAVIATAAAGQRMSAEAQAAVLAARAQHRHDMATAARILAEPAPPNEDELALCHRADHYLLEGAG